MKALVAKTTAEGEQINMEVEGKDLEDLRENIRQVTRALDERMLEMNMRIVRSNKAAQALSPEAQMALHQVVEVLHGRRPVTPEQAAGVIAEALDKVDVMDTVEVQKVIEGIKEGRDNVVQFGKRGK